MLFSRREAQAEAGVVVVDDGVQRREAPIMEEAAFRVRENRADW